MCVLPFSSNILQCIINYFHNSTVDGQGSVNAVSIVHSFFEGVHHRAGGPGSSSAVVVNLYIIYGQTHNTAFS